MLYRKLRKRMYNMDIDQKYLARKLDLSSFVSVSQRFTGKTPWKLNEIYIVLKILNLTPDQMHIYFPEGGKADTEPTTQCDTCPFSA